MKGRLWLSAAVLIGIAGAAHADDVAAGKTLYVGNCQWCHGTKGAQLGDAANWAPDLFRRAVLTGVGDRDRRLNPLMPRWGKVGLTEPKGKIPTDQDLSNIQAYLKTFGPTD